MKITHRIVLFILISTVSSFSIYAQEATKSLRWEINTDIQKSANNSSLEVLSPFKCLNCFENIQGDFVLPYYSKKIRAENMKIVSVRLKNIQFNTVQSTRLHEHLTTQYEITQTESYDKGQRYIHVSVTPLRKNGQNTEYLTHFEWDIKTKYNQQASTQNLKKKKGYTYTSILASGENHKVRITQDGVYKITRAFLSQNGINPSEIQLSKFKIYGNGGLMLPELIAADRVDDLIENAIYVHDENSDNLMDNEDYILWYAKGPTKIEYKSPSRNYDATGHDFEEAAYYFLNWAGSNGKRINSIASGESLAVNTDITEYDHIIYHEKNDYNHIKSGRKWWGDKMQIDLNKTFNFKVPGLIAGRSISFRTITTARFTSGISTMRITANGLSLANPSYNSVTGSHDDPYASRAKTSIANFSPSSDAFSISYHFNKSQNDAAAWIDYFVLTIPRHLNAYAGAQQHIRINTNDTATGNLKYSIGSLNSNHHIWNISTPFFPARQQTFLSGGATSFVAENTTSSNLPMYLLFDQSTAQSPSYVEKVENQNLHALDNLNYLMITHTSLTDEANRLADFHRERGLVVEVVTVDKIYNEFSSGTQDVTAIRDFSKMLYDRSNESGDSSFLYLLLFGDASYDYKDKEESNTNLVPIYQNYNSNYLPSSFCSDDYYAILDDNEGYWGIASRDEGLDLNVGRLPVTNLSEAKIVVDKIYHYHSEASRGDWIQTLTFVGDDENQNAHIEPSDDMTVIIQLENPGYNIKKIWMDAYEQISFGSGNKYPKVNEEITKMITSKGTLVFNYVGHGGENGMAHERVVTRPEIVNWDNYDKLSFYVTASCEIAKIDNLSIESPGELMLFNPNGGAIGMLATTRAVYIGGNTDLNTKLIHNNLFKSRNGKLVPLGEAYRKMRNVDPNEPVNDRCFILLADPAMSLLSPDLRVVTTAINGTEIGLFSDTLKALELVSISGEIRDLNNSFMPDFNGELFPTFYDKPSNYKTLGQDAESNPMEYTEQDKVIYKGKVSVINGKFLFKFIVPKDIAYNVGKGKLSYYAKDGLDHAGGSELSYYIGGTGDSLLNDTKFDELLLYIDDESWVFGGGTSPTPKLFATLYDSSGINTIGSGIGREMEAIVDAGTDHELSIVLNDFYKPNINSYQSGKLEYNFEELSPGRHTLNLKVWDVYNNSAEAYTEFVVSVNEDIAVRNLLNYPNPFNRSTAFHFDHNKAGQQVSVSITITSIAGNIVKTLTREILNAPAHSSEITWDGRDDYGDPIGRGVYLYTLNIKAEDGTTDTKTEKLYIIN